VALSGDGKTMAAGTDFPTTDYPGAMSLHVFSVPNDVNDAAAQKGQVLRESIQDSSGYYYGYGNDVALSEDRRTLAASISVPDSGLVHPFKYREETNMGSERRRSHWKVARGFFGIL